MSYRILPAAACLLVIRKIVTYPLVNLTKSHFLFWRAVDCKRDKAGVAVGWLPVFVLLYFLLVQCGVGVDKRALLGDAGSMGALGGVRILNGSPHGQLGKPVHRSEAALEL